MRTFYDDVADPPRDLLAAIERWALTRRGSYAYASRGAEIGHTIYMIGYIGRGDHIEWNSGSAWGDNG